MEMLFTSGEGDIKTIDEVDQEYSALTLSVDELGITEGVTIGLTVSAVALVISILLVNLISWLRR